MAKKLEGHWDGIAERSLEEEGVKA
jgi:hypothetical protein